MDGAESVRSNRSERSHRSHGHSNHGGGGGSSAGHGNHHHRHHHHHHRHHRSSGTRSGGGGGDSSSRAGGSAPDDRSVTIKMPAAHEERVGSVRERCPSVDGGACDDNWGDDTTAVTGNTSETGWSSEDVRLTREVEQTVGFRCCSRRSGGAACIVAALLVAAAYGSPIVMVVLPALRVVPFKCPVAAVVAATASTPPAGAAEHSTVGIASPPVADCSGGALSSLSEGMLIGFAVRLLALAAGVWALFCRQPRSSMPRVHAHRALVLFVLFVLTIAYWLVYGYRALNPAADGGLSYDECVQYASTMVDALLFLHYAAIVLMELRHLQPAFCVKLLRSPDGQCRTYHVGQLSVQRAAAVCLEHYYRDFAAYNPYLENAMRRRAVSHSGSSASQGAKFKVYDVDGSGAATAALGGATGGGGEGSQRSKAILAAEARRRDASHNERFYQESEYERRVHKRRARLITAAEEAFTHVKRYKEDGGPAAPMDSQEAAQAIFPSMARSLQKYLRVTRQQPWHTMESILDHLADCLQSDASARAFLEPYLAPGSAVVHNPKECADGEQWSLACDGHPGRSIAQGTRFTLRKGEVSLLCVVKRLPFFTLVEEPTQPESKSGKFVLRLNSETSV